MLIVHCLTAGYGPSTVLQRVSFTAEDASITAILGAGGAGKTTLANAVCGFLPVSAGQVIYGGHDITHRALGDRIHLGISYVPSGLRLFSDVSVLENLRLGAIGMAPQIFRDHLDFVLSLFPEVKACLNDAAAKLPSSVQRAVMFARGVINVPRLLVLDQPSFGLKGEQIHQLFRAISRVNRECGTAVLLMEQKIFQALKLAETAWLLEKGRIMGERSALELLADRSMQADFLRGVWQPLSQERAA